jgi:hypothetical protein
MEQEFLPLNSRTYQFISNKNITVSIATKMQLLGKETLLSKKREFNGRNNFMSYQIIKLTNKQMEESFHK